MFSSCLFEVMAVYMCPKWQSSVSILGLSCSFKPLATPNNIETSFAYSAYRCLHGMYSQFSMSSYPDVLQEVDHFFMHQLHLDPHDTNTDRNSASGVGNSVAENVLLLYSSDHINNFQDMTNYYPINDAQSYMHTDCTKLRSVDHWQPLLVKQQDGTVWHQTFSTPHMTLVRFFALQSIGMYDLIPPPPPSFSQNPLRMMTEIENVVNLSSQLTDENKMIVEYWADGPHVLMPAGHFTLFSVEVAHERRLSIMQTVVLLFLQSQAAMDAGIASWTVKRIYDTSRPITTIRCGEYHGWGENIQGWRGPYRGVGSIPRSQWTPYMDKHFVTPPFPEYVSGHSTFGGAWAEIMRLYFNGDDTFGHFVVIEAGRSLYEPRLEMGQSGWVAGLTDVPNTGPHSEGYSPAHDVKLYWPTFTSAAEESGISRLYGGVHYQISNENGQKLGRKIGKLVFERVRRMVPDPHFQHPYW